MKRAALFAAEDLTFPESRTSTVRFNRYEYGLADNLRRVPKRRTDEAGTTRAKAISIDYAIGVTTKLSHGAFTTIVIL